MAFIIALGSWAQQNHLTFMGIPINGNINSFILKLSQKGMKLDADANKSLPFGEKMLRGLYLGKNVVLTIRYTPKTKTVYTVEVGFSSESNKIVNSYENDFIEGVKKKYKNNHFVSEDSGRDKIIYIFNTNISNKIDWESVYGILHTEWMTIHAKPKSGYSNLREKIINSIKIYYIDKANSELRDIEISEDI